MCSSILIVLLPVDVICLGELWLNLLLPLCLANCLCLLKAWSTILGTVDLGRTNDVPVDNIIVRLSRFDVWRSVFLVVWSDVR